MTYQDFNLSKTADGLLPVIIQDADSLKVLMLGYMNQEAFEKTLTEGRVTFYSRTRQTLWTKGETSGNFLHVVEMFADCDGDTLLIKARPDGPHATVAPQHASTHATTKASSAPLRPASRTAMPRCPRAHTPPTSSIRASTR